LSNLFVDKISGKSGTSSGAPITLSGDTATLGSGVTIPAAGITGTLGSGVFPVGHVVSSWFTVSNRTSNLNVTNATNVSTGATANVTVTAGNDLFIWYFISVHGVSARHWGSVLRFDGVAIGDWEYGEGINNGDTTKFSSWENTAGLTKKAITTSGTFEIDLLVGAPDGTIQITNGGNVSSGYGYDGTRWMALEIQR
jgi:hypothetical protein